MNKNMHRIMRLLVYFTGMIMVSAGIVLCKQCGLGVSPVSSLPFVLARILPFSFGTWTTLFHFGNTLFQISLRKTIRDPKLLLQFLIAFAFGVVIDGMERLLVWDTSVPAYQAAALVLSILLTAAGMVCMIRMDLVQNPPDGTVRLISIHTGSELGKVKNQYDAACVVISFLLGILCLRRIEGFGIATILSAVFVGRCVSWLQNAINNLHKSLRKE